jgi:tetratricopeptide (TPR) repeat protein
MGLLHKAALQEPRAVIVCGFEHLLLDCLGGADVAPAIEGLNRHRDLAPQQVPVPVVFVLSTSASRALAAHARDLWDVVLTSFHFEAVPAQTMISDPWHTQDWQVAPLEDHPRLKREADLLERTLAGQDPLAAAESMVRLGEIHRLLCEFDEALPYFRRATDTFREIGDRARELVAWDRIAEILEERGESAAALRIRRKRQLPICEKLDGGWASAVTLGRIADVLQDIGELDEALRLRREEELPFYEREGEHLAQAITLSKIADVLQARGELDEALRIRREQVLPTIERYGDTRDRAMNLAKIAAGLQERGEGDEAFRIYSQEVLPALERVGDERKRAATMGKLAEILEARGEVREAIRIREEEEIPTYDRLGCLRDAVYARALCSLALLKRNSSGDREHAHHLLATALESARRLRLPETEAIQELAEEIRPSLGTTRDWAE